MTNGLKDLQFGVQALRRRVERDAIDLGGALGVQAALFPHQAAAAARVLWSTEVRHLLADEVGMGKTVEALMILNALRLQDRGLRVLIVVPNHLLTQWRDELLARGHEAPVEGDLNPEADRCTRLAWPERLQPSEISPDNYDMLVVDEFHALTAPIQRKISETAKRFNHLLLISATPPFQDRARLDELMEMLEPARCGVIRTQAGDGGSVSHGLLKWDRRAAEAGSRDPSSGPPTPEALAEAHCAYRRVIRARREDYPHEIPPREHISIIVEPTEAEARRQPLMWQYMRRLPELTREFDEDLLAQRVVRSAASLQQRVTYLRGHGHERDGLLEQVAQWLSPTMGDSRLDALCDLLAEIWRNEPSAKVLVAAGDNLTVDDLADRVPGLMGLIGPPENATEVRIARVRNQPRGPEALADPRNEVEVAAQTFTRGDANLMLAADVGMLGLNLQVTRHLVLYSIPWDPQEVEQWVGRVDRLGNHATWSGRGRMPRPIRIYTIAQRGLVDERVLEVIQATSILKRSISLDSTALQRVQKHLRAAVLTGDAAAWREVLTESRELGHRVELTELGSVLLGRLRYTPRWAGSFRARVFDAPPIAPYATADDGTTDARAAALLEWLRALREAEEYDISEPKARERFEMRYRIVPRPFGRPIIKSRVTLGEDLPPTPWSPAYFVVKRATAGVTARRERQMPDGSVAPVYYMNHGSPLHERLLDTWIRHGEQSEERAFAVAVSPTHPCAALVGQVLLLVIAQVDSAEVLGRCSKVLLVNARLRAQRHADERYIRGVVPCGITIAGATVDPRARPTPVEEQTLASLLWPPSAVIARAWNPTAQLQNATKETQALVESSLLPRTAARCWAPFSEVAATAAAERKFVLHAEQKDEVLHANGQLETAHERARQARADSAAKAIVSRRLAEVQEAETALVAIRAGHEVRLKWWEGVETRLATPTPKIYRAALVKVEPLA